MTELPPEIEGKLQAITCQVHSIELQNMIRELVTEQQAETDRLREDLKRSIRMTDDGRELFGERK